MCSNIICGLFFSFILYLNSISRGHWINLERSMQSNFADGINEISSGIDLFQKLPENNFTNTSEKEILFWEIPDTNDTVEVNPEVQMNAEKESEYINVLQPLKGTTEGETNYNSSVTTNPAEPVEVDNKAEENKTIDNLYNDVSYLKMDEKIVLQRNNCNLEIAIQESHDLRIEIKFERLQNNTSGKCCITLIGEENNTLGVFISNIYLYQNASGGEVLKVITPDLGSDFILKEYYSWTKYLPLLLTETHKVYVVLYYQVTDVPPNQNDSHFDLEVFSYHRYENYVNDGMTHSGSNFSFNNGVQNFSTPFFPYFH